MLRAFSIFGLGGIFLAISPKLREQSWAAIGAIVTAMEVYAPYSYVLGVILVFFSVVVAFNRGARAR